MRSVICLCILVCHVYAHKICKVPNGGAGTCILLTKCTPLMNLEQKRVNTSGELSYIQQSLCSKADSPYLKVCCPSESSWSNFIARPVIFHNSNSGTVTRTKNITNNNIYDKTTIKPTAKPTVFNESVYYRNGPCGKDTASSNKIQGGIETSIDQYSWLVLLEYSLYNKNDTELSANCGGALINTRFVLSAAHCLPGRDGYPTSVIISEYDRRTWPTDRVEADGGGTDNITQIRVKVSKTYRHPDYSPIGVHQDIGIVKLAKDVEYGDFVKAICLPEIDFLPLFNSSTFLIVAGWGTNSSRQVEVKSEVNVPYVSLERCLNTQQSVRKSQICAGGVKGKDSCNGDSGGPLMYEYNQMFYAVGVVSYGPRQCGAEGIPAVYTNVYEFMPWIQSVISRP